MAERRLSTPLVLAAASAMLAIAGVIFFGLQSRPPEVQQDEEPGGLRIDDSSPERAAESFYDAWRRRRWPEADRLSVGEARHQVHQKQASDEGMNHDDRIIAERGWEALAAAPLDLHIEQVDMEPNDRFVLQAVAEYELVGAPYRRRVTLRVRGTPDGYRVERMDLGDVLTELPPMFRGGTEP
ncbi:MAG: hypothetical protein KC619_29790 [Myxococcales bacterium]|nr:hypothetical protein [Myxococcales bacterium]